MKGGVYVVYNVVIRERLENIYWHVNVFQTFEYADERERLAQLAAAEHKRERVIIETNILNNINTTAQTVAVGLIEYDANDQLKITPWAIAPANDRRRPRPANTREVWTDAFTDYANARHKKRFVYVAVKNPGNQYQVGKRQVDGGGRLEQCTVAELRQRCAKRKIPCCGLRKVALIAALRR